VEYQVWQSDDGADVDIVARADVDTEAIRSTLERRLATVGLGVPRVAVRRVDGIDRQGSGKLKRFVPLVRG